MFTKIFEAERGPNRHGVDVLTSLVLHSLLVVLAVQFTANAAEQVEKMMSESIVFAQVKPPEPAPPEPKTEEPLVQQAAPDAAVPIVKGFQVLTAPIDVPDVIPPVDLSRAVTDEADFSGKGVAGGIAKGVAGGTPTDLLANKDAAAGQPYFEFQVEKPAIAAPGNVPPRYPETLRDAGIEGKVYAQFVIDTAGRAEPKSFKVLQSDSELFTIAVRNALPTMRFLPAEVGGRKVRVLVQQPFEFMLSQR